MTMAPSPVFQPTLPGRYYTDPAIFDAEQRSIFSRQWVYACRTQDVPSAGRFIRVTVADENVLVVRGRDEVLRGFLNVCRHRGATLCAADSGEVGRAIRCPYHSWSYRLDGSLRSAPNWDTMATADKADLGLHPVHLAEFHGMVWVNLAAAPAPLDEYLWAQLDYRLGADRAKFARYDLASLVAGKRIDYTVAANWKIIQENFQECYHCSTIHPELVDTIPQFRDISKLPGYVADGYDFAPETIAGYDIADTVELFHLVNEQDFAATEACQPNMRSRAYAKGGVLVPLEQEIIGRWYYDWYRASMNLGESP